MVPALCERTDKWFHWLMNFQFRQNTCFLVFLWNLNAPVTAKAKGVTWDLCPKPWLSSCGRKVTREHLTPEFRGLLAWANYDSYLRGSRKSIFCCHGNRARSQVALHCQKLLFSLFIFSCYLLYHQKNLLVFRQYKEKSIMKKETAVGCNVLLWFKINCNKHVLRENSTRLLPYKHLMKMADW